MFKKIVTTKRFWVTVLYFSLAFIALYNLFRIITEYKFNFGKYFGFYFTKEHILSFLVFNLIAGGVYGLLMAYYLYWRQYKRKNKNSH